MVDYMPQLYKMRSNTIFTLDPRNLEIKTKSVEDTLLPLVTQVNL